VERLGHVPGRGRTAPLDISSEAGLSIALVWPEELASELHGYDAVVTIDVPPDHLPLEILRSYVERGGGWLALIGDDSLPRFAPGTAVDFLPLRPPTGPGRATSSSSSTARAAWRASAAKSFAGPSSP
jgi:hypothetical protein